MHVLILWMFNIVVVVPPYPATVPVSPPLAAQEFVVPATMMGAEFSSLAACEAAATSTITKMKAQASPAIVNIGYSCNKKA